MFLTAYVDVSTWKFYFRELFLAAPLSQINRESFSEHVAETAVPEKPVVIFDTRGFGTWLWRAAFAFLAQASLTPSRWCQLSRRSVWAPFWRGARARAPGYRSWNVRAGPRDSAASSAWGSSGAISARRWSAGDNHTNLALVVPGRLSQLFLRFSIGRSPTEACCSSSSVERGFEFKVS